MKTPVNMPLPWEVTGSSAKLNAFLVYDEQGTFFEQINNKDQEQAAAYIQHCVNNYPALVEALEKLAKLGNGDQYGNSNGNVIAQDALRKAGEL